MTDNTKQPEIDYEKEAMYLYSFIFHQNSAVQEFGGNMPTVPDSSLVAKWLSDYTKRVRVAEREATLKDVTTFGKSIASLAPLDKEKVVNEFIALLQVLSPKGATPNG